MLPKTLVYDGENRPVSVTSNANTIAYAYGPDGERAKKTFLATKAFYLGNDTEIDAAGLLTSSLHPDVKRAGSHKTGCHKDHLATNRPLIAHRSGGQQATTTAPSATHSSRLRHPHRKSLHQRTLRPREPASNTSMPATTTPTWAASSPPTPGTRYWQAWTSTDMPMPGMIRSMAAIPTGISQLM